MLALTEPPLGFESLAWPGFGLCPNPGENLATTFLRNRTDIHTLIYRKKRYIPLTSLRGAIIIVLSHSTYMSGNFPKLKSVSFPKEFLPFPGTMTSRTLTAVTLKLMTDLLRYKSLCEKLITFIPRARVNLI